MVRGGDSVVGDSSCVQLSEYERADFGCGISEARVRPVGLGLLGGAIGRGSVAFSRLAQVGGILGVSRQTTSFDDVPAGSFLTNLLMQ
jgi:hypothetical protein